ncbi:cell division protein ZipA [Thalassotalea mangrovi]|uniref:Cell division protein ZipA n=1 Tax=Thalassotalea mangrovi TaxID=2572245 RepID=A0A4U1B5L1_9GAMM|nr:cell division protein ZipA [Thalassotalea mangrovi]TKB45653.1 cell division protein ZipA [Thalassotalea mangrovi]
MEFNLRLILLLISVAAITGLCIHGMYTLRKDRKNPYKLKSSVTETNDHKDERMFDQSGFDQDGVGATRVVSNAHSEPMQSSASFDADVQTPVRATTQQQQESTAGKYDDLDIEHTSSSVQQDYEGSYDADYNSASEPAMAEMERIFENYAEPKSSSAIKFQEPDFSQQEEPVLAEEPVFAESSQAERRTEKTKAEIRRDQMEIDFADQEKQNQSAEIEQEVLAISVVAGQNQLISGAALLPSLLTLGMKYGEMNIFHRHQDNSGKGPIHFSLANMINPGTFDLDHMENFATTGLTLFMTLPNAGDPTKVFKLMLSAAKQLASEFGGQVLDGQRSVMTRQTEQHYLTKIREFDRKSRIANV